MTALEAFLIIVLAGIIIVLVYYFLMEMNRTGSANFGTVKSSFTEARRGVSDAGGRVSEGISQSYHGQNTGESETGNGKEIMAGVTERVSGIGDSIKKSGVSEKVSGYGDSLKGKVKGVPVSTDDFSGRIDEFLNDQSDRLIKDWELATKSDLSVLEKKYSRVSRDVDDLTKRFDEFRGHTNKKFENIEERLASLESEEET